MQGIALHYIALHWKVRKSAPRVPDSTQLSERDYASYLPWFATMWNTVLEILLVSLPSKLMTWNVTRFAAQGVTRSS